jgi:hypothetical protein
MPVLGPTLLYSTLLYSTLLHCTQHESYEKEEKRRQPVVTAAVVDLFDLVMITVAASGIALLLSPSLEFCCRHTSHHSINSDLLLSSNQLKSTHHGTLPQDSGRGGEMKDDLMLGRTIHTL